MLFKNLIPDAVQAVHEFHERKLWKRFTNFDCFGIRIPNRQDLLLACVMGDAGEQYGLMMLQGSHAAKSFSALTSEEGPGDDATEAMDMLGFSMSAFGEMATESQAFFRKAGVHPQYDEQVPEFLVKPPNRNVRLPQDEELALLTSIVKAVVAADRRKLLQPAELNDPAGICVITLGEDHENAPPSVARERLPQPEAISQPRAFAASGMDLSDLELLDSIWLVGTPVIPGGIKDDERSMLLLLVADDASEMILQAKPFFSECIQEAVDALVETFRGHQPEGRRGIAQTIVFSNRLLHDTVTPALQEAGVKCIFMPSLPKLQGITKDFLDFMGRKTPSLNEYLEDDQEDEVTPAPDDLAGWKEADYRLSQRFADHLFNGERLHSSRAIKRYFDNDDIEHFFKEHEERGVAMAFSAWGMLDYRPGRNSQTQAEKMLAQGLPDAEAMLLRARMKSYPTFYRVAGHNPKAGTVDLEDVLLGGKVTVHDQLLSENVDNNVFLISRAFPAGRFHFIEVAGPPLGPHMGIEAVEFLRDCDLEFTHEGLKREAHKFGWLWGWIDQWQANWQPPHLCNTDGDDLLVHTASFAVADPDAIKAALLKRKDINHDEQKDEYVWSKNTGKGVKMLGGPVTLGRIEFIDDELVLTVNSARRFKTARAWLTKLPGVSFRNVTTQSVEPGADRPLDSRISKPQPVEITPDMAQNLQEIMDKQYMQWIDTPLPILGGKTPRKACRTDAGREQVTTLIRTIPDPMGSAPVHVPRQAMLRELGLVSEDHGPWLTMPPSPQTPLEPGLFESDTPPSDKVGRNDPCPCGSGKKFKKCCGR